MKMNFFPLYMVGKTSALTQAGSIVKLVVFIYSILWSYEFYLIKTLLGTMQENIGHFGRFWFYIYMGRNVEFKESHSWSTQSIKTKKD